MLLGAAALGKEQGKRIGLFQSALSLFCWTRPSFTDGVTVEDGVAEGFAQAKNHQKGENASWRPVASADAFPESASPCFVGAGPRVTCSEYFALCYRTQGQGAARSPLCLEVYMSCLISSWKHSLRLALDPQTPTSQTACHCHSVGLRTEWGNSQKLWQTGKVFECTDQN